MNHQEKYQTRGLFLKSKKRFTVAVDRRLEEMPYAQAGIRDLQFEDGTQSILYSFDMDVAWIDGNNALTVTQSYSLSSVVRKHVWSFIRQICAERELPVPQADCIGKIVGRDRVLFLKSGFIRDHYNGFVQD